MRMMFSTSWWDDLVVILIILTRLPFVWCNNNNNNNSNISVNVKSKVLTDILTTRQPQHPSKGNDISDGRGSSTPPFPATTATSVRQTSSSLHGKRDVSDILRLDLSGRLNLYLWGISPSMEEEEAITRTTAIRPLFPLAASTADGQASPMISRSSSNMIPISVKVGLDYDLSGQQSRHQQQYQQHHHRGWYGIQRVLGSLEWQRQCGRQRRNRQLQEEGGGRRKQEHNNNVSASISHFASKLFYLPRRVQFIVERGINTADIVDASSENDYNDNNDNTYAAHIKVGWDADALSIVSSSRLQSSPFVKMGVDWIQNNNSNNKKPLVMGAMTCSIPLHQRFLWRGKISYPLFTTTTNSDFIPPNSSRRRRIPMPPASDWNDVSSWLIPDVTVNAMSGQMESNNQAWLSLPTIMSFKKQQEEVRGEDDVDCDNSRGRGDGRLGIRLTIRRHFDFDYPLLLSGLLGSGSSSSNGNVNSIHDHSSMTAICLEIKGMTSRTITTARFETALEAPLDAAHLSLLQYYLACDDGRQ